MYRQQTLIVASTSSMNWQVSKLHNSSQYSALKYNTQANEISHYCCTDPCGKPPYDWCDWASPDPRPNPVTPYGTRKPESSLHSTHTIADEWTHTHIHTRKPLCNKMLSYHRDRGQCGYSRSLKVICCCANRCGIYDFLLALNSNLISSFNRSWNITLGLHIHTPPLFHAGKMAGSRWTCFGWQRA